MSEEAQILLQYEENQVLWAKIRGFPWWPAYVNQVHSHKDPQKVQYTVIFFGDNTHSRLGPSKLRKFLQSYTSFYIKSKTNRKLKISIMKAQQRLKQNQQNVQIYQQLRSSIKTKRKTGTKTQSRVSSSENQDENQLEISRKIIIKEKSRTVQNRGRKPKKYPQNKSLKSQNSQQQNQSQEQSSNKQQKNINSKKQNKKHSLRMNHLFRSSALSQQNDLCSPSKRLRTRRSANPIVQSVANKQSQNNQQISSQKSKSVQKVSQKKPPVKGRKGRPRKIDNKPKQQKKQQQVDSQPFQSDDQASQKPKTFQKRKISQRPLLRKIQNQNIQPNLSVHQIKNLQKIKKCIQNKSQLLKTLSTISITPNNIKEILDLGVSNILLQGQMTKQIYIILESMKATLLHKFFPDDLKMKKKHERMIKKKKNILRMKAEEDQKSQKNQNQQQKMAEQNQQGQEDQIQQLGSIRKKTVLKIQRILKKSGLDQNAKNLAMKLQASFQEKAQNSGQKYANIAYSHMRKLKNKVQEKEPSQRIVDYLNQITESMENSGQR